MTHFAAAIAGFFNRPLFTSRPPADPGTRGSAPGRRHADTDESGKRGLETTLTANWLVTTLIAGLVGLAWSSFTDLRGDFRSHLSEGQVVTAEFREAQRDVRDLKMQLDRMEKDLSTLRTRGDVADANHVMLKRLSIKLGLDPKEGR